VGVPCSFGDFRPGCPDIRTILGAELDFNPTGTRALLAQAGFAQGRGSEIDVAYPAARQSAARRDTSSLGEARCSTLT